MGPYIDWEEFGPQFTALLSAYLVIGAVWLVLQIVAWWRIFTKAGEKGWKSLIPFYSTYIQFKISWDTVYFWILLLLPLATGLMGAIGTAIGGVLGVVIALIVLVASLVATIISVTLTYRLSQAFGHGVGFALGLLFLQPIFALILGLGGDQYLGNPYARRI